MYVPRKQNMSVALSLFLLVPLNHAFVAGLSKHIRTTLSSSLSDTLLDAVLSTPSSEEISSVALDLVKESKQNVYNPDESLFGPLYCTVAAFTPNNPSATKPLWERVSLLQDNLKGQQYTAGKEPLTGTVINYSEVLGPTFHLRAEGSFVPESSETAVATNIEEEVEKPSFWKSLVGGGGGDSSSKATPTKTRPYPDDYRVTINKASFCFGDSFSVDLPIQGSSVLRVLYADPKLRIFVSPEASESLAGDWENAGLVVVQVRSDLVSGDGLEMDLR